MNDKNRNLFVRLATALVLLPAVLWLVWQGGIALALLLGVAAALCALELNLLPRQTPPPPAAPPDDALSRKQKKKQEAVLREEADPGRAITGAALISLAGAFFLPLVDELQIGILSTKLILVAVAFIAFADTLFFEEHLPRAPQRIGLAVLGAVWPGLFLSSIVRLRQLERGEWWVFLALVVTFANDTGAYFAGRFLGKHKLYPRISPSKTWEGAAGGGLASIAGALVVQHFCLPQLAPWAAAVLGAGAAVLGPLGDFSESMLKRAYGAKDSGKLLPGHGGMLDRIDALLFNAPFVLLCARLLT